MNILHINQSDISGGASIAGYRLHQGLLKHGIDSRLLVAIVKTKSDRVDSAPRLRVLDKITSPITRQLGLHYIDNLATFNLFGHSFFKNADLVNFHNLHNGEKGYFNYLAIPSLTKNKPAIFTLHDMWSFTGHCAYSYDCDHWKTGCGKCPYPNIYPAIIRDNTNMEWKLKNWVYQHSNLTIVTPSCWLNDQAKQSILKDLPIYHIPYGIDTEVYKPLNSQDCKLVLGIPKQKKVLMFAATNLTEARKGGSLLLKALQHLPDSLKAETVLLTFGHGSKEIADIVDILSLNLGYISNDYFKAIVYSAADLFIFPTRADNLPLMLQESMACGTPMVSFKTGGVPDLVRPGITGYLAQQEDTEDTEDFCHGIVQLLEDENLRDRLSKNCREIALKEYSLELQAQRYIELYRQILQNQPRGGYKIENYFSH